MDDTPVLRGILERISEALIVLDHGFRCVYLNRSAARRLARPPEAVLHHNLLELFPNAAGTALHNACVHALREQVAVTFEGSIAPLDGWFEARLQPTPTHLVAILQDVSERKRTELELGRSERRYRVLSHALSSVVWQAGADGRPTHATDWGALTGHPVSTTGEPNWAEVVHPEDAAGLGDVWRRALERGEEFDHLFRLRHADGHWLHLRIHGVPVVQDGVVQEWIGVVDDLSDHMAAEEALRRAAFEDPLTGLPNRTVFLQRLHEILARRRHCAAILYVDLDDFKSVNDRFGHATGDALLREVADRLLQVVRPSDIVSRLSGDEFAIICDDLEAGEEATTVAARLCQALSTPLAHDERVHPSASIGVTVVGPDDSDDPERVLRAADAAMYRAKALGGGAVEVFDDALRQRLQERIEIEAELRAGLRQGALNLHFQPIIALDGEPPSVESLLRWQRPGGPAIPASDAISVAEATGLIAPIGRAVLALACQRCARWDADIRVAVNVSARQLARPDQLVADVTGALEASGLPPERLALEITETVLMDDMFQSEAVVNRLRALGVHLEIDDFGVGYSSLSYLHRLPVHALKLDRTFIAGLPDDTASARILEAVVGLASAFEIRVIAEGVETMAQLRAVRDAGCHAAQGYALARPCPGDELPQRLREALAVAAR
ncbi:EAL domain-containing protein [Solirubrobacter sp. CPCC 204708]|uniref:EAL domain-containing protein n=1 Tax=Solirubrobacter deserti TaxID=2282478 RepID=A0ABT4RFW6_9ACTN|nr:EAL domain-containing protein [Solirubrobacter deserti]MBE2319445.1 EAL domain-containing protein [Solirubrobacter deserti]MDA0137271.1 EAL domain-containing protein [Solirubrobacter deserti]